MKIPDLKLDSSIDANVANHGRLFLHFFDKGAARANNATKRLSRERSE